MSDDYQKIIAEQEKEIKRLKNELKKAVSLRSFCGVFVCTIRMSIQDLINREKKIKFQNEKIHELEQLIAMKESAKSEEKKKIEEDSFQETTNHPEAASPLPKKPIMFQKCSFTALKSLNSSKTTSDTDAINQSVNSEKDSIEEIPYIETSDSDLEIPGDQVFDSPYLSSLDDSDWDDSMI